MSATRYFAALHEEEYAVAGNVLAQTISVAKGPVPIKMPTSMFDSLRKLNLPVEIKNGMLHAVLFIACTLYAAPAQLARRHVGRCIAWHACLCPCYLQAPPRLAACATCKCREVAGVICVMRWSHVATVPGEIILTKEHAMNLGGQPLTVEQAKALVRASDPAFVPEAVPRLNVRLLAETLRDEDGDFYG